LAQAILAELAKFCLVNVFYIDRIEIRIAGLRGSDLPSMSCAMLSVLMIFSAFSHTLCLRIDPISDEAYDPWEDKSVDPEHRDGRDIRSYHGLFENSPLCQQKGAPVSHATALNRAPCPDNAQRKEKVLFIHIPKTGGESVEGAFHLQKNHGLEDPRHDEFFNGNGTKRDDILVISVIRNPFSRTWSWFKFCVHGWRGHLPGPQNECLPALKLVLDLQNFGKLNYWSVREAFSSWLKLLDKNEHHTFLGMGGWKLWTPMSEWIVDRRTNTAVPDYMIRFETYQQDWDKLCECLGMHIALPHENDSGGAAGIQAGVNPGTTRFLSSLDYRSIYSDTSEATVLKWFGDDFARFAYSRNPTVG